MDEVDVRLIANSSSNANSILFSKFTWHQIEICWIIKSNWEDCLWWQTALLSIELVQQTIEVAIKSFEGVNILKFSRAVARDILSVIVYSLSEINIWVRDKNSVSPNVIKKPGWWHSMKNKCNRFEYWTVQKS